MPRSVNVVTSHRKRRKFLRRTRGQFGRRKNVWTVARNSWEKGQLYAYRDRRAKKRSFRALWITRINAAARENGTTYGKLIAALKAANVEIDRKVLAELAVKEPKAFAAIVKNVTK